MNYDPVLGHLGDQEILYSEVEIEENEMIVPQDVADSNKN